MASVRPVVLMALILELLVFATPEAHGLRCWKRFCRWMGRRPRIEILANGTMRVEVDARSVTDARTVNVYNGPVTIYNGAITTTNTTNAAAVSAPSFLPFSRIRRTSPTARVVPERTYVVGEISVFASRVYDPAQDTGRLDRIAWAMEELLEGFVSFPEHRRIFSNSGQFSFNGALGYLERNIQGATREELTPLLWNWIEENGIRPEVWLNPEQETQWIRNQQAQIAAWKKDPQSEGNPILARMLVGSRWTSGSLAPENRP